MGLTLPVRNTLGELWFQLKDVFLWQEHRLSTRRLYAPHIRQAWFFPLVQDGLGPLSSGLVLGLVLTLEFQKLWSLQDNFPRCCDRVLFVIWQAWWWCHFRKYSALRTQTHFPYFQISVCRNVISLKSICVRIFSERTEGRSLGYQVLVQDLLPPSGSPWQLSLCEVPICTAGTLFCLPPNTV